MSRFVVAIVSLLASIFSAIQAIPTSTLEEGFTGLSPVRISTVQGFALKFAKDNGDTDMMKALVESNELSRDAAIELLIYGGIKPEYAELAYDTFLPALETAGVDQETQFVALRTIANLVCKPEVEECDVAEIFSYAVETPHYGCNENCFCLNQKDIHLWTRFVSKSKQATDEMEGNFYCSGLRGDTLEECSCEGVQILDVLAGADPVPRQTSDVMMNVMLQNMASSGASLQTLSIMANMGSGAPTSEVMKQMMMAQMGLDPSMTHLMLNGGKFSDDPDQNKAYMYKFLASSGGIPIDMIPLLSGDPDAKDFLLYNMILAGDIDPMTGFMMLSSGSTVDQAALNNILTQGLFGGGDLSTILEAAAKPYMPELPHGIYPGSHLSFAHFEALQVSTCALHDLRNRFECGYIGISAYNCEIAPYCCYSPVFMTDAQVLSSTDGAVTAASSVPWCYYNVFFVFPTEFHLTVQNLGGFPAPYQCLSFFKFGLELDPMFAALSTENPGLTNAREDCGFPGITEFHCVAIRGCCFDANAPPLTPQCHKPLAGAPSILNAPVPDMFIGVEGQCDVNIYKVPFLYYKRVPCHYTLAEYQAGFDVLQHPTKEDCLTRLHCCYESNDAIAAKYPNTPRCYQKLVGGTGSPLPISAASLQQRAGEISNNTQ